LQRECKNKMSGKKSSIRFNRGKGERIYDFAEVHVIRNPVCYILIDYGELS
jgi:hypothetical protein